MNEDWRPGNEAHEQPSASCGPSCPYESELSQKVGDVLLHARGENRSEQARRTLEITTSSSYVRGPGLLTRVLSTIASPVPPRSSSFTRTMTCVI